MHYTVFMKSAPSGKCFVPYHCLKRDMPSVFLKGFVQPWTAPSSYWSSPNLLQLPWQPSYFSSSYFGRISDYYVSVSVNFVGCYEVILEGKISIPLKD